MVIGFDASRAFDKQRTGTENYSYQLLKALGKIDKQNKYVIYTRGVGEDAGLRKNKNFKFVKIDWPRLWTQGGLALGTWKDELDVLFVPAHTLPVLRKPGLKTVVTIHGLEYEYLPEYYQFPQKHYLTWSTRYAVKSATRVIAVSEFTKRDLVKRWKTYSGKIEVVQEGVDIEVYSKSYKFSEKHSCLKKLGIRKPYLLFVGVVQPRKNLARLIEAFSKLVKDGEQDEAGSLDLVIAGRLGWMYEDVFRAVEKFDVKEKVKFLGFVEQADLPIVFQEACCYVQPSLTEGFGLPVLEAMASGVPVIAARSGALTEVVGDAGMLVDPYAVDEIARAIKSVTGSKELQEAMREKGCRRVCSFTWERTAKSTLEILEKAVKGD